MIKIEVEFLVIEIDGQVNHITRQEAKELQEELDNLLGPINHGTVPSTPDHQPVWENPYPNWWENPPTCTDTQDNTSVYGPIRSNY